MPEMSKKKIIGITGSMGSGKSQVSRFLSTLYPVIDCDRINAKLLETGQRGYACLVEQDLVVLDRDLNIDKMELSRSMFSDPSIKKKVESILHPLIFEEMHAWIRQQESDMVFVEVPILFEIQAQSHFDSIWCVVCDTDIALQRLCQYRQISKEEALRRLSHQMSVEEKIERATHVLYNNGSIEHLEKQIMELIEREQVWN